MFFRLFSSRKIRAARRNIATAPTAMPAIAPAGSVEEVVEGTAVFDEVAEVDEAGAVAWPDVVLDVELLVVLLVVLELEVLVELELMLEAEG